MICLIFPKLEKISYQAQQWYGTDLVNVKQFYSVFIKLGKNINLRSISNELSKKS